MTDDSISKSEIKDCRNCKYGKYNDHFDRPFCYCKDDCEMFDKWEDKGGRFNQQTNESTEIVDGNKDDGLLTPEERADLLNKIVDLLDGTNLQVFGYDDSDGVFFKVLIGREDIDE